MHVWRRGVCLPDGVVALRLLCMTRFRILSVGVVLGLAYLVALLAYYSALPGWRALDFLLTPGQIMRALDSWSDADKARHLYGTRVLDTIFPAFYGVVLVAVCRRYWRGRVQALIIALTIVAVAADYTENYYNLRLLNGMGGVGPHLWATWIKFLAIAPPMNIGLVLWMRELRGGGARNSAD